MATVALGSVAARAPVNTGSRVLMIDGLRGIAAMAIAWHHFAQYWPLSDSAQPVLTDLLTLVHDYARVAQVFFVIGGFVMARSMSRRRWTGSEVGRFVLYRYCRLGLPYLAVIGLAIGACAVGRGYLPEELVGAPPTLPQVLAHAVFLQDILGYGSLSAGLWFVCINFQLGLMYALILWMRDTVSGHQGAKCSRWRRDASLAMGFVLSATSLFYFNLNERWSIWCVYFFAEFFLGVLAQLALQNATTRKWFGWYVLLMATGIAFQWRWRLVTSLGVGLLLYFSERLEVRQQWSTSGIISRLGRISYSLFLIHFPVFIIVASIWLRFEWGTPWQTLVGLGIAFIASLIAAEAFYRLVEESAARLSRALT
ncbi:MAG TPA: acyltransferase [Pirellulales bacterium]|jgi:peptidoglycan/LPS O-acetylase OafA/YrhL